MKPLLFLDRDATLIEDTVYPKDPDAVKLLPGAAEAIRELATCYQPAVVSNQSGIARGHITPLQARLVHERFVSLFLEASGVELRAWYCPHSPDDACGCRKPEPGLLRQAAAFYETEITAACVMIGDKPSDTDAGQAAGCGTNLLFTGDWSKMLKLTPRQS
ncbi:MAG: D-glycero-alpha-D-manno-heptose-1,7-bisphosphate 7-phosphatase [Fimbriiglobus sp.]